MFERFTDRARRSLVLAQEEARQFNHNYIGTQHVLLGLLMEGDGVGARALTEMGVTPRTVKLKLRRGPEPVLGHIPYTGRAKKVLELALREALQLGHNYIGTEHLLLAIIREGTGQGAQILGANLNTVRTRVLEILGEELEASTKQRMHIVGIREHDEQWSRMKTVYDACMTAHVDVPDAVTTYFKGSTLDGTGPEVDLKALTIDWSSVSSTGLELDLSHLPDGVTKLRFYLR